VKLCVKKKKKPKHPTNPQIILDKKFLLAKHQWWLKHTCKFQLLGKWRQEDCSSRQAWAKS
jgi:hypothetical protein